MKNTGRALGSSVIHYRKKGSIDGAPVLLAAQHPTTAYRFDACPALYQEAVPSRQIAMHCGNEPGVEFPSGLIGHFRHCLLAPVLAAERDFQWQGILRSGSKDVSQGWRRCGDGREQRLGAVRSRSLGSEEMLDPDLYARDLQERDHDQIALGRDAMMKLDKIIKYKGISFKTKKIIAEALVLPVATYECENWALRKEEREL
ncbi:hypothetical protein LAZ67_1007718 [Cordylochernes scorpioides]|uniref:Uncharacterized protein n=1 Tax=Cordylochernes scorpioides TaxID=51811 RepID=A0ABY6JZG0_9ARAC|nr:hypothetical protein LAZ67_1007718 [Cordylochernes scorpioides]